MSLLELILLRHGWTPARLNLPDDVVDPKAPALGALSLRANVDRYPGRGAEDPPAKNAKARERFAARGAS